MGSPRRCVEPFVAILAALMVWEIAVHIFGISRFILPAPSRLFVAMIENIRYLSGAALATLKAILLGYALGALTGLALGIAIGLSRPLERSLYHVLVFLQTMPKVAIAPLLIVWLGHGIAAKLILIALVSFIPTLISTIAGIKYIDPRLLYITRSMGGSFWQSLVYIRIPAAGVQLLSGLKTSLIIAVTVAVVVEFVSANDGLGYVAMIAITADDLSLVFAAIVFVAGMGLLLTGSLALVERRLTRWLRD